jgi:hypothetical protein
MTASQTTNREYTWILTKVSRWWLVEQVRNTDGAQLTTIRFPRKRLALAWIAQNSE